MALTIIGKSEPTCPDSLPEGHPAEELVVTPASLLPHHSPLLWLQLVPSKRWSLSDPCSQGSAPLLSQIHCLSPVPPSVQPQFLLQMPLPLCQELAVMELPLGQPWVGISPSLPTDGVHFEEV